MPATATPATQPVARVVLDRIAVLSGRVDEACRRLGDVEDGEALHDFRVGLRRLWTVLRVYAPHVPGDCRKVRRRLRALARSTNGARDAEVMLEWLAAVPGDWPQRDRFGLEAWIRRLQSERCMAYDSSRTEAPAVWLRVSARLGSVLRDWEAEDATPLFGPVTAAEVRDRAKRLHRRLSAVSGVDADMPAHRARIDAKRLRYVLEPFRESTPAAKDAVRELRRFQEAFGNLHDMHVLLARLREEVGRASAERGTLQFDLAVADVATPAEVLTASGHPEVPGLLRLARRAAHHRRELYQQVERRYLRDHAAGLLGQLSAVAAVLEEVTPGATPAE